MEEARLTRYLVNWGLKISISIWGLGLIKVPNSHSQHGMHQYNTLVCHGSSPAGTKNPNQTDRFFQNCCIIYKD